MEGQFKYSLAEIKEILSKRLKPSRLDHSCAVAYTAASVAMSYGIKDLDPFLYAGLLHDCAKFLYDDEFVRFCEEKGIPVTDEERRIPVMLHGKVGAYMARTEFGIEDEDILNAIENHTDGRPNMSFLEKAIHIADHIEPGRKFNMEPTLEEVRRLAFTDIDRAIYFMDKAIIDYLNKTGKYVMSSAFVTVEYFEKLLKIN